MDCARHVRSVLLNRSRTRVGRGHTWCLEDSASGAPRFWRNQPLFVVERPTCENSTDERKWFVKPHNHRPGAGGEPDAGARNVIRITFPLLRIVLNFNEMPTVNRFAIRFARDTTRPWHMHFGSEKHCSWTTSDCQTRRGDGARCTVSGRCYDTRTTFNRETIADEVMDTMEYGVRAVHIGVEMRFGHATRSATGNTDAVPMGLRRGQRSEA